MFFFVSFVVIFCEISCFVVVEFKESIDGQ